MKQPRVPEYREADGVKVYIKSLILFLKDFAMAVWAANNQRKKDIDAVKTIIQEMPEIVYPVTSVNGKAGDVTLSAQEVGALGREERAADSACFEGKTWRQALDMLYPVGSVYISTEEMSPAERFGGAWERIEDTFLLAAGSAYAAGSAGGEATHKLTISEMPKHLHNWSGYAYGGSGSYRAPVFGTDFWTMNGINGMLYAGGSEEHNNMPPYLAVYMWKRVE